MEAAEPLIVERPLVNLKPLNSREKFSPVERRTGLRVVATLSLAMSTLMATGLQTDPGFNDDADNLPSWGLGETVTFDETLHPARWRTYVVDELVQPFVTGVVQERSHYEKFLSTRRRSGAGKSTLARYPKLITFHGDIRPDVLTPAPGSVPSASNKPPVMNFTSRSKQHFVEGVVDGTLVDACPDSGADRCFISPRLASDLGLYPADGTQKRIVLANKKHVESPGMVKVPWRFVEERRSHTLDCWILPGCVHDLVLGCPFLVATQTLTRFTRRNQI